MPRSMSSVALRASFGTQREKLVNEHQLPSQALAHAGIGLWWLAAKNELLECDHTAARLLGPTAKRGSSDAAELLRHIHADDRKGLSIRLQLCARTGAAFSTSFRVSGEDGEVRWLEATAHRMQDAHDELVVTGTFRDITK